MPECPGGKDPLQYKVVMEKKPATSSVTVSVAVGKGARGPGFVLCANVNGCCFLKMNDDRSHKQRLCIFKLLKIGGSCLIELKILGKP